jgi:uncharacterized damage-inducible protein DinB
MEMDPILHLQYHAWATAQLLDAAKSLPAGEYEKNRGSSHGGVKDSLIHIFKADNVWFSRVAGEPFGHINDVPVPESLAELEKEWMTLLQRFQNWFRQLQPNQYGIEVRYTNSQGDPFSTPLWQIVLHLVNHGTLHRGQVMGMMRQAGVKPPATDLIFFYRTLQAQAAS